MALFSIEEDADETESESTLKFNNTYFSEAIDSNILNYLKNKGSLLCIRLDLHKCQFRLQYIYLDIYLYDKKYLVHTVAG